MTDPASAGFFEGVFDRTLTNLRSAWREIAESARGVLAGVPRSDLSADGVDRLREQMLSCLDGRGGEVTARARAADLGRTYLSLDSGGRERFLQLLAREFDVDREEIDRCCNALINASGPVERAAAERALRAALEPPRITLLRQFNALPEGVKFLVDRRAELIDLGHREPHSCAARRGRPDRRSARGRRRDLLLDFELPARSGRDQLWRFPDQA